MKVMRMFCLMLAAGMLALGLAGCPGEQYLECGTESCDPGTCIPGDGADATCDCPPGYKQGEGLTCVMGGLPLGAICTEDSQCVDGRCLKYTGQAEGYCTKTDCGSDSECVNHADDGLEMCCVEVDVAFFICMKIGEGCQCGDGTGTCGASCTCMSDSACQPGFPCLATSIMDPGAICSKQCTTDDDCNDCVGGAEDEFACIAISGGDKYCLKSNVQPCERNLDCDEGEVCMVDVVDGLLVGSCGRQGALDPGAECNDEDDPSTLTYDERCAAVFCFNDMCSSVCTLDSDCPEGMTCETIGFIDMPEQTIDMCFGPPITGEAEAGDPCPFNGTNADADYCLPGLACLGYDRAGVATPCTTDEDCFDVLPPAENPDCADDGMCGASFCSPPCDENNECEDGFYPALVGDDCYCIPETTGTSPAGGPCPFNGTNDDADFCQSGLTCLGYDRAAVNYPCDDDEDCLEALPPAENPDCADDGMCGASFCSPPCDENNECEPGFYPALVGEPPNQQCYCIPETTGSSGPGDPCPFNGTHADADYCQAGMACLGYDREAVNTECVSDDDCLEALPPGENPECADDGLCGASFCAPPCDENNECEAGFYPALVGEPPNQQCYCIPETTGDSGPGDPCPFNGTNVDADYCQAGMACLGYDRELVDTPCDSDDDCTAVIPPAENPDCADDSLCGGSFCAPPCDENDECEAGFYPAQVGEPPNQQCYCIPETTGSSGPGDPCPFNGTHADADYCQAGMACLGYDRDVVNTPCDSDDDCTEVIPPVENPECADDSLCGGSFCAPPCDENGQCDDGFVPDDVSGDCYCIPVMTGDAVAGDPCPFGDINVSADYCVAGLSCIGMEPSDQILCPTDVSECIGDDIYSTWNPECIGGECGMSFCAAPCNETEPYCDTGFEQILVGLEEDCFCAPEEL